MEGTCGVGTSLVDRQPILVHRDEHFRSHNIAFTCSSAPIFGIDDDRWRCSMPRPWSPENRESQVLVFQMVVEKARLIEDAFAFHSLRSYWILQLGRSPELMHVHTDYLVAFDDGGHRGWQPARLQELLQRRGPAPEYIGDLFECSAARSALCVPRPPGAGDPAAHPGQWRALRPAPRPDARPRSAPHPVASGGEAVSTAEARGFGHLATDDPRVRTNVQRALKVVNRDIPVMLLGETGTGKEAFAKAIHDAAPPQTALRGPQLCGDPGKPDRERALRLPGRRLHRRRHQVRRRRMFLDEIGDMPLVLQSRLLRVLAEARCCRWAPSSRFRCACTSSAPPTRICRGWWPKGVSGRICTTGSTARSSCRRRCGSGRTSAR
jgi:transcriptional regulator of acetoin/glycerol metabolism